MSEAETSPRATTRGAKAAATRQRIVTVAVRLFSSGSYDDVAVADVAKQAGVAYGSVFQHFGSKRGLYLEAMRASAAMAEQSLDVPEAGSVADLVRAAMASHLTYVAENPDLFTLIHTGSRADPEVLAEFEEARWRLLESAASMLGLDRDNEALRLTGRASVGAVDHATYFWLQHEKPYAISLMVETLLELFVSGLRAAAILDPTLEVSKAIDLLQGADAEGDG